MDQMVTVAPDLMHSLPERRGELRMLELCDTVDEHDCAGIFL